MIYTRKYSEVNDWTAGQTISIGIAAIAVVGTGFTDPGLVVGKVSRKTCLIAEVIGSEVVVRLASCTVSERGAGRTSIWTLYANLSEVIKISREASAS